MNDIEPGVREDARSIVLIQRNQSDRVAVLFHGFTASPPQLARISAHLFASGWNVVVPRLPLHGYEDRLTKRFGILDLSMLTDCAETAIAFANTLGSRLLIGGFSLGATLALWMAHRHAAQRVVAIAPLFGLVVLPAALQSSVARCMLSMPNYFFWWDPFLRERNGSAYGYPRFATHPVARALLGTQSFLNELQTHVPRTKEAIFGLNARETTVSNDLARRVATQWKKDSKSRVLIEMICELPPSHDIFDPSRSGNLADRAFPRIIQLFDEKII
jgi:pimeloyl-ACP methyl ester carboxylesterase